MIPKRAKGKWVVVYFHDHSLNMPSTVICSAVGYVSEVSKLKVKLVHWLVHDESPRVTEGNNEFVWVVQAAVIDWTELKPTKKGPTLCS